MSEETRDAAARIAIREQLDTTFVVEASAGTGKTSALVERILALIGSGKATLGEIVAVTFTDKAAGEMKLRLRGKLEAERARAQSELVRERFEQALAELETAHIATVHSFCLELLRKRPIEAGIDPAFNVIGQEEELQLLDRAFDRFLQRALEDLPESIRRALKRRGGETPPSEKLRNAAHTLIGQRDFDAPWQRPELDREREIAEMWRELTALADSGRLASNPRDMLGVDLRELGAKLRELDAESGTAARPRYDFDRIEHGFSQILRSRVWTRTGSGTWLAQGLLRADMVARREETRVRLEALVARLEGDLASRLREELREVVTAYEALKQEAGALDFLDLLLRARDLLRDDATVRAELQAATSHVFIDEFQDIDALQAEVLLALAAAPGSAWGALPDAGKLFVVGDPKQSIYGFRRADLAFYERLKRELLAHGATLLQLSRSYRANDAIQGAVNAAFAQAMPSSADGVQAQHQALERDRIARSDQPSVIALAVPRPYSAWGRVTGGAVAESTAEAVAAFVDHIVTSSGWLVEEQGAWVPARHSHVLLLFRSMRGFGRELTRPYARALEARGIPHVLASGRLFHAREEVMALRALLTAVEWPDDELAVYSALRGPFFALTDSMLLEYRGDTRELSEKRWWRHLHPLAPRIPSEQCSPAQAEVAQALDVLREAFYKRNERPLAQTLQHLLTATRAHAGLAFWPNGEQALANVQRVVDEARRFDAKAATSFRAFVERLDEQARRGEASGASMLEEGSDGVRIMTVHGAKGLEHPIVILCEPTEPLRDRPSHYIDSARGVFAVPLCGAFPYEFAVHREALLQREHAEETRLTYVAATRARDLLVVPCVGDKRQEGWVSVLHPAFYPSPLTRRDASPAAGCPAFGTDSVLDAPARVQRTPDDSVAPGQHVPEHGEHRVVWWDPRALVLDRKALGGVRQQELLAPASDTEAERTSAERYARFEAERSAVLERASAPLLRSATITTLAKQAAQPEGGAPEHVSVELVARAGDAVAAGGARFGSLVHATLADLLSAHAQQAARDAGIDALGVATMIAWHARVLGATEPEQRAAHARIAAAWEHPLLQRARASQTLWVELPIALRLDDGVLGEGAFDFAFREAEGGFVVVDLKTDDPTENAGYAAQVALYARAIARATGEPARGILLGV